MANLLKAFALFTFGFVILANLGDALEKKPYVSSDDEAELVERGLPEEWGDDVPGPPVHRSTSLRFAPPDGPKALACNPPP